MAVERWSDVLQYSGDAKPIKSNIKKGKIKKSLNVRTKGKYYLTGKKSEVYLTIRQRDVLSYLVQGYSINDIKTFIPVSRRTVQQHVFALMKKFNFSTSISMVNALSKNKVLCDEILNK